MPTSTRAKSGNYYGERAFIRASRARPLFGSALAEVGEAGRAGAEPVMQGLSVTDQLDKPRNRWRPEQSAALVSQRGGRRIVVSASVKKPALPHRRFLEDFRIEAIAHLLLRIFAGT
jgi:hypothetical protein